MKARSLATFALILALGACSQAAKTPASSSSSKSSSGGLTVTVKQFAYAPPRIEVPVGSTVVWTNTDQIFHTATSGVPEASGAPGANAGAEFDGVMDGAGTTFKHTFAKAGSFKYFCRRHSTAMFGEVVVT